MSRVILISGRAQSGKSTSAAYLKNILPGSIKEFSMADSLKEFCIQHFGVTHDQMYGSNEDKTTLTKVKWQNLPVLDWEWLRSSMNAKDSVYLSARELLEVFGSNICRWMYPDCWANACKKRIVNDKVDFAIVSDIRFPNEISVFADLDPVIIRLNRNPLNRTSIAEKALDDYDFSKYFQVDNKDLTITQKNDRLRHIFISLGYTINE